MESKGLPQKRQRNVRTVTWMNLYKVKPFPDKDVVQTEGRLVRGCVRRVLRGAAVFCGLTSADVMRAIRESSAVRIGAR